MKLSTDILEYIDRSVLCWLATADNSGQPNVSPKEVFKAYQEDQIIIANIASPQSVRNIRTNNKVCVSFVNILTQKGFQVKGFANVIKMNDPHFEAMKSELETLTQGKFPFNSIIAIQAESAKPIIAPRYVLYPETTEEQQIKSAMEYYKLSTSQS